MNNFICLEMVHRCVVPGSSQPFNQKKDSKPLKISQTSTQQQEATADIWLDIIGRAPSEITAVYVVNILFKED